MKYLIALLLFALAGAGQAATMDSQYIVVVGEDAPTTDVILGANFAASMKGTVGVTFSSAIDTEIYREITVEELRSKTIVVIDGEERRVKILGTSNAAAAAQIYFNRQGFAAEQITEPIPEDVLVNPVEQIPEPDTSIVAIPEVAINRTVEIIETRIDPQPILQPNLSNAMETKDEPQRSLLVRITSWFRSLF